MTKFSIISLKWLVFHQNNVTAQTLDMYKIKVEKLNECFGDENIKDIKIADVQEYISNLYSVKGLSKSTIKKYKITLNLIFKYAMKMGIIDINIINSIDIPRINDKRT